ncbi:MAG: carbon-nitrogen hydrolase [Nitrososphaerales archaeon]
MKASSKKDPVTIGLIQSSVSEDVATNIDRTAERVHHAADKGAQIVCLQELYRTRYFPSEENKGATKLAETIPGDSTKIFSAIAKERSIVIIVPVFEKSNDGNYYNSAAVIDADGRIMDTYRKTHVPFDPLFYEKNYFKLGNSGYKVYRTHYANFSVFICYDQWFPEASRIATLKGADILFYPTAIGWIKEEVTSEDDWHDAWETIQRSHAIANGVHVASVNRVGDEGQLRFWGGSFVCDSFGKVLKKASSEKDEVLVIRLDLNKNRKVQEGWGFLKNRRPDTYGLLCKNDGMD